MDSTAQVGLTPISKRRFHRLAYLANTLSRVYSLKAADERIVKYRRGPFYPDLQWHLDRLAGENFLEITNVTHEADEVGPWMEADYALNRNAIPVLAALKSLHKTNVEAQFLLEIATAYARQDDAHLDDLSLGDLTYADERHGLGAVINFKRYRDNLSARGARAFKGFMANPATLSLSRSNSPVRGVSGGKAGASQRMSSPTTSLPGFDAGLAEKVFVSSIGLVPPYAAAELQSFFVAIHRCCVDWLGANQETADQAHAAAFVLSERPDIDPALEDDEAFNPLGRMDKCPPAAFCGKIVIATRNLRMTFGRDPSVGNVAAMVEELQALGLGDRPTAIFVPAERTLTIYRRGVDDKPTSLTDMDVLAQLDPTDLPAILEFFHENWTRFPDGRGACWDNAGNRVVEKNAERNIRNALFNPSGARALSRRIRRQRTPASERTR